MRLATQILVAILGITILSQVAFALVTYLMIRDGEREYQLQRLAQKSEALADQLATPLRNSDSLDDILRHVSNRLDTFTGIALLVGDGDMRRLSISTSQGVDLARLEHILQADSNSAHSRHGRISIDGEPFFWASTPIPASPQRVVLLSRSDQSFLNLLSTLTSRYIAISVIIAWCAVWVALLLSSMIGRKLNEKSAALKHQVTHDTLTGLPNRALLYERLAEVIERQDTDVSNLALLVIDIDGFKEINDTLGQHFGDQMLLEVGARIQETLSEQDCIARLGGDEFALLLPDASELQASAHIERILHEMHKPCIVDNIELEVGINIGAALFPQHTDDMDVLVRYANVAVAQAKERGCRFAFYDDEDDNFSVRRLVLGAELRNAISRNELILHYQPQVSVASGKVIGLEALVRWQHPSLGMVPPDEFIPLAERTGAIIPLTEWVLEEALRFLHGLHQKGANLAIAINVSAQNLRDAQFPVHVLETLKRYGIASQYVSLEITESAMMQDIKFARAVLQSLHDLGIGISIDDFGTGFSSFAYLTRLPVDELKVDRSFVRDMQQNPNDRTLVHSIVELAHSLDFYVVAEGVEDGDTLATLRDMKCDVAQGYFISRPLAQEELCTWLYQQNAFEGAAKKTAQTLPIPLALVHS